MSEHKFTTNGTAMPQYPRLELQPIELRTAIAYIKALHRHHIPPRGWKFGIGLNNGEHLVGVIVAGRPIARGFDDGWTLEVTRCCTDGSKNAASMLYGAAARAAAAGGYRSIITYTRTDESGVSLRAAGWEREAVRAARSWAGANKKRLREDKTEVHERILWRKRLVPLDKQMMEQPAGLPEEIAPAVEQQLGLGI